MADLGVISATGTVLEEASIEKFQGRDGDRSFFGQGTRCVSPILPDCPEHRQGGALHFVRADLEPICCSHPLEYA